MLGRRIRVEHWANALQPAGGRRDRSMLGRDAVYDRLPYFFTDQYDLGMEYVGYASADDEVVVRGDLDGREFVAFWVRDGRVVAGHERQRLGRDRPDPRPHPGRAARGRVRAACPVGLITRRRRAG